MASFLDLSVHPNERSINGLSFDLFKVKSSHGEPLGDAKLICLHWTAGTYTQVFDDYHFNVVNDKRKQEAYVVKTLALSEKGSHLWGRNTGAIGISMCAMVNSSGTEVGKNAGPCPVTLEQVQATAVLVAEICAWKKLDPRGTVTLDARKCVNGQLTYPGGTVKAPVIADHATFAKLDHYFPDRWDVDRYLAKIRELALEHYDKLKAGKVQFQYLDLLKH